MARNLLSTLRSTNRGAALLGAACIRGACVSVAALGLTLAATAVIAAPSCRSEVKGPTAGSFGFDWLQPNSATCRPLQADTIRQFRSCTHQADGTFGLRDPAHACRIGEHSELLIYADKATCERNLEVMQSNGP